MTNSPFIFCSTEKFYMYWQCSATSELMYYIKQLIQYLLKGKKIDTVTRPVRDSTETSIDWGWTELPQLELWTRVSAEIACNVWFLFAHWKYFVWIPFLPHWEQNKRYGNKNCKFGVLKGTSVNLWIVTCFLCPKHCHTSMTTFMVSAW